MPAQPHKTLTDALVALQAHLPRVVKEHRADVTSQRTGRSHSYDYANLTDVTDVLMPLLAEHGLAFVCCPNIDPDTGRFTLEYTLRHVSGEHAGGFYPLPSGTSQEIGSAITYARRYALCSVTGVAPGGDDDDARSNQQRADGLPVNRDGSLARSQLTDEQRDQAGVMTSAQAREHGQLRKLDHPRPAERSASPSEGDPWTDQPAGERQDVPAENRPASSNSNQHRQLGILYGQLGFNGDQRHEDMTNRTGRTIETSLDLSYKEAEAIKREVAALVRKRKAEA